MSPPGGTLGGPRRLLRRLRDLMAGPGGAQDRLDRVVDLIASDMVAEVCSVYLMRPGEVLELFGSRGLRPEAVHRTRLRLGEGLVGDIAAFARPLSLADAQAHPKFAYRPETGEEIYKSLLGVPIMHGGRVLGVLVVQNRALRNYSEDEAEALQFIAMVLAEMVAAGELIPRAELEEIAAGRARLDRVQGARLSEGLAMGVAVLHEPQVVVEKLVADDPAAERRRLRAALARMQEAVEHMVRAHDLPGGSDTADILETYRMFAHDRGWFTRMEEAIASGLTAEAAVLHVQDDMRGRLSEATDPALRERFADLRDLTGRLLQHLSPGAPARPPLPAEAVVFARSLGPAELLDYDRRNLKAVVMEEGSVTSHAVIIARALEIPVIGRIEGVLAAVVPGNQVIVDGDNGVLFLRPGQGVIEAFRENLRARAQRRAGYAAIRHLPAETVDGVRVTLNVNAGLLMDLGALEDWGAAGVGLFRTEVPFLASTTPPDEAQQTALYRQVLDLAGDRPVLFRTFDFGADKAIPWQTLAPEPNPAIGWRGLRFSLDRPAVLRRQLRALIRAAAGRPLSVMFPMVSDVGEYLQARALFDRELTAARSGGQPVPAPVKVGVMIEVPALLWQLPTLAAKVDFMSIGSNDLLQFLYAADRGNPRLGERYDALSPAMLTCLRSVILLANAAGVPVALCGEMAGRPLEAMVLVGLGLRHLSMSPAALGPVKAMIRSLRVAELSRFLASLEGLAEPSLRSRLLAFARDHGIAV